MKIILRNVTSDLVVAEKSAKIIKANVWALSSNYCYYKGDQKLRSDFFYNGSQFRPKNHELSAWLKMSTYAADKRG